MILRKVRHEPVVAACYNLLLAAAIYQLCRAAFFLLNMAWFPDVTASRFFVMAKGGLQFDVSAIAYTNGLYLLLQIVPFRFRQHRRYQAVAREVFMVANFLAITANCMDIVYFRFTNRRTTASVFSEFSNESNIVKVLAESCIAYWYVPLLIVGLTWLLRKLYYMPRKAGAATLSAAVYYPLHTAFMVGVVYITVIGMRGGAGVTTRPITISNANRYVNRSVETAVVLNTPFSILRTSTKKVYVNPKYFPDEASLSRIYSPLHTPHTLGEFKPLNVVILIVESFGKEYSGFFNRDLDNGSYTGYTPFADSLYQVGLTFKYSYSNGRKSIDAMPSALSSIPMFVEPFIVTHYSNNDISSIAAALKTKGYYSAFFHGAPNGSMGFDAYARSAGYDDYFGLNEYGNRDMDGTWAVWDEEFLQFFARKMGAMRQPFITTVFTATSHHPFRIPARYEGHFPEGTQPIHKCIGYTDNALRRFFKTMSQYEWFDNTLFVLTADHTNQTTHKEYLTDLNSFSIPILFYHPGGSLTGIVDSIPVQQIDIMPSVLSYLNYDQPYFAFGQDIFSTQEYSKFVANYNNQTYQILHNGYFMQFDGQNVKGIYDCKNDVLLQHNLLGQAPANDTEQLLKAVIQQYLVRMIENRLRE
jgi:phosphoglycerol transferase MdoB-like AlkP superfamily enzyme